MGVISKLRKNLEEAKVELTIFHPQSTNRMSEKKLSSEALAVTVFKLTKAPLQQQGTQENGKQTNQNDEEQELANKNNLLELKKWVHSYVQQTWPITWEEGQNDLKEIIEREIDPSLFGEVRNEILNKDKPRVEFSVVEIPRSLSKTKSNKNFNLSFKAKLGVNEVEFTNKMATPLAFENRAKDVVHLFVMKDDCPLWTAFIPLSEVKENEPQNWTLKGPNGENMDEIAIQAKFKYGKTLFNGPSNFVRLKKIQKI